MPKIMIVDDDVTIQLELEEYLTHMDYTVVGIADTGAGAVEMASEMKPDLILMDVQLPGMDGLTATRLLKEDTRTSSIPVVALTAQAMVGDQEKAEAAGCNGYMVKPIDTRQFPKTVASYLT